jgi:hypothetical protein
MPLPKRRQVRGSRKTGFIEIQIEIGIGSPSRFPKRPEESRDLALAGADFDAEKDGRQPVTSADGVPPLISAFHLALPTPVAILV